MNNNITEVMEQWSNEQILSSDADDVTDFSDLSSEVEYRSLSPTSRSSSSSSSPLAIARDRCSRTSEDPCFVVSSNGSFPAVADEQKCVRDTNELESPPNNSANDCHLNNRISQSESSDDSSTNGDDEDGSIRCRRNNERRSTLTPLNANNDGCITDIEAGSNPSYDNKYDCLDEGMSSLSLKCIKGKTKTYINDNFVHHRKPYSYFGVPLISLITKTDTHGVPRLMNELAQYLLRHFSAIYSFQKQNCSPKIKDKHQMKHKFSVPYSLGTYSRDNNNHYLNDLVYLTWSSNSHAIESISSKDTPQVSEDFQQKILRDLIAASRFFFFPCVHEPSLVNINLCNKKDLMAEIPQCRTENESAMTSTPYHQHPWLLTPASLHSHMACLSVSKLTDAIDQYGIEAFLGEMELRYALTEATQDIISSSDNKSYSNPSYKVFYHYDFETGKNTPVSSMDKTTVEKDKTLCSDLIFMIFLFLEKLPQSLIPSDVTLSLIQTHIKAFNTNEHLNDNIIVDINERLNDKNDQENLQTSKLLDVYGKFLRDTLPSANYRLTVFILTLLRDLWILSNKDSALMENFVTCFSCTATIFLKNDVDTCCNDTLLSSQSNILQSSPLFHNEEESESYRVTHDSSAYFKAWRPIVKTLLLHSNTIFAMDMDYQCLMTDVISLAPSLYHHHGARQSHDKIEFINHVTPPLSVVGEGGYQILNQNDESSSETKNPTFLKICKGEKTYIVPIEQFVQKVGSDISDVPSDNGPSPTSLCQENASAIMVNDNNNWLDGNNNKHKKFVENTNVTINDIKAIPLQEKSKGTLALKTTMTLALRKCYELVESFNSHFSSHSFIHSHKGESVSNHSDLSFETKKTTNNVNCKPGSLALTTCPINNHCSINSPLSNNQSTLLSPGVNNGCEIKQITPPVWADNAIGAAFCEKISQLFDNEDPSPILVQNYTSLRNNNNCEDGEHSSFMIDPKMDCPIQNKNCANIANSSKRFSYPCGNDLSSHGLLVKSINARTKSQKPKSAAKKTSLSPVTTHCPASDVKDPLSSYNMPPPSPPCDHAFNKYPYHRTFASKVFQEYNRTFSTSSKRYYDNNLTYPPGDLSRFDKTFSHKSFVTSAKGQYKRLRKNSNGNSKAKDVSQTPLAVSSPKWNSEKAINFTDSNTADVNKKRPSSPFIMDSFNDIQSKLRLYERKLKHYETEFMQEKGYPPTDTDKHAVYEIRKYMVKIERLKRQEPRSKMSKCKSSTSLYPGKKLASATAFPFPSRDHASNSNQSAESNSLNLPLVHLKGHTNHKRICYPRKMSFERSLLHTLCKPVHCLVKAFTPYYPTLCDTLWDQICLSPLLVDNYTVVDAQKCNKDNQTTIMDTLSRLLEEVGTELSAHKQKHILHHVMVDFERLWFNRDSDMVHNDIINQKESKQLDKDFPSHSNHKNENDSSFETISRVLSQRYRRLRHNSHARISPRISMPDLPTIKEGHPWTPDDSLTSLNTFESESGGENDQLTREYNGDDLYSIKQGITLDDMQESDSFDGPVENRLKHKSKVNLRHRAYTFTSGYRLSPHQRSYSYPSEKNVDDELSSIKDGELEHKQDTLTHEDGLRDVVSSNIPSTMQTMIKNDYTDFFGANVQNASLDELLQERRKIKEGKKRLKNLACIPLEMPTDDLTSPEVFYHIDPMNNNHDNNLTSAAELNEKRAYFVPNIEYYEAYKMAKKKLRLVEALINKLQKKASTLKN